MRALALALLVALAAFAGAARAGPAPSDAVLLARHAPVLVLHPLESFPPSPVEPFVARSELQQRAPDGTWAPAAAAFPPPRGGTYRLDVRGCSVKDGVAALDCYADDAARAAPPTAYGAVHRRGARIALQYWLFYPLNLWSPAAPPRPDFWQMHEGDWELVTVLLDREARPLRVGASRHCGGLRRDWAEVERRGARPVIYVSLGSHANGFVPEERVVDPKCWPSVAVTVYRTYGVPMLDHAARGRAVRPRVVPVTATSPTWMAFAGAWGEDQYAGFPQATFRFGGGPTGPATKPIWREPVGVPARWPRG